jgi:hypothetical protein
MTDDSSSRKEYPVNALIVAFALVVLGVGLGSVFRTMTDEGPKQDPPAAVVAPQPAPQPAPANPPPIKMFLEDSQTGIGRAIRLENHGSVVLYGVQYRTWNSQTNLPYVGWMPLVQPMLPGQFTRCDVGMVPSGLPIFQGDVVEVWVPGYDLAYFQ